MSHDFFPLNQVNFDSNLFYLGCWQRTNLSQYMVRGCFWVTQELGGFPDLGNQGQNSADKLIFSFAIFAAVPGRLGACTQPPWCAGQTLPLGVWAYPLPPPHLCPCTTRGWNWGPLTCRITIVSFPLTSSSCSFLTASTSRNKDNHLRFPHRPISSMSPDFCRQRFTFIPVRQTSTKARKPREHPSSFGVAGEENERTCNKSGFSILLP